MKDKNQFYSKRIKFFEKKWQKINLIQQRLTTLRFIFFFALVVLLYFIFFKSYRSPTVYTASALITVIFLLIGWGKDYLLQKMQLLKVYIDINQLSIERLNFNWAKIPYEVFPPTNPTYDKDLNIFGEKSLFHWINNCQTSIGKWTLRDWFLQAATPEEIIRRQEAISELSGEVTFRQDFIYAAQKEMKKKSAASTLFKMTTVKDQEALNLSYLNWFEQSHQVFPLSFSFRIFLMGMVAVTVVSIVGQLAGLISFPYWLPLVLFNLFLSYYFKIGMDQYFNDISKKDDELRSYLCLIEKILEGDWKCEELKDLQASLYQGSSYSSLQSSLQSFKDFSFWLHLADYRRIVPYYVFFQGLFLADFFLFSLMEFKKKNFKHYFKLWLKALGTFESLLSLSEFYFAHADWVFPKIKKGENKIRAEDLIHPLIPQGKGVGNDFCLGEDKKFYLVTGSNMSGKSTFLRSLGVSLILAQMGAPVRAKSLSMPPTVLATSISVEDSLSQGISFYFAELLRLKEIIEMFKEKNEEEEKFKVFLFDEILRGTNSSDRIYVAGKVLSYLHDVGACGIVTTQDEDLCTFEDIQQKFIHYHFREIISKDQNGQIQMDFNYKLQLGVNPSTNGRVLAQILGVVS